MVFSIELFQIEKEEKEREQAAAAKAEEVVPSYQPEWGGTEAPVGGLDVGDWGEPAGPEQKLDVSI